MKSVALVVAAPRTTARARWPLVAGTAHSGTRTRTLATCTWRPHAGAARRHDKACGARACAYARRVHGQRPVWHVQCRAITVSGLARGNEEYAPRARRLDPAPRRAAGPPDEYAWMRVRGSRELRDLCDAENAHTMWVLGEQSTRDFARTLRDELHARAAPAHSDGSAPWSGSDGAPELCRGYWYWSDTGDAVLPGEEGATRLLRCRASPDDVAGRRQRGLGPDAIPALPAALPSPGCGPVETILDFGALGNTHDYAYVSGTSISPDDAMLAFTLDTQGDERFAGVVRRLGHGRDCGVDLPTEGVDVATRVTWANVADPHLLYYVVPDDTQRPCEVWRRSVGDDARCSTERVWPPEGHGSAGARRQSDTGSALEFLDAVATKDNQWITINANTKSSSEVWLVDATDRAATPRLVTPRRPGVQYFVEHNKGWLYIVTNADGADDFKVVRTPVATPGSEHWQDVVPARDGVTVQDLDMFDDHFVLYERVHGVPRLTLVSINHDSHDDATPTTAAPVPVALPSDVCDLVPGANQDIASTTVRFAITTCTAPELECDLHLESGAVVAVREQGVGGHPPFSKANYVHSRLMVESVDGTPVPVDVVHSRHVQLDGSNPLLMQVYGAYGVNLDAQFEPHNVPLLDRGWVLAFPHVRGGSELGRAWHDAGRLDNKLNTFHDCIAAAEAMVSLGYSQPSLMALEGHSAGGMVVGYVANTRPDLFSAMLMRMPFVDVLGDMLDESLPLTAVEYEDWGDPRDPAVAEALAAYSPYDNVVTQVYPSILAVGAMQDPRVGVWHALSYIARVREATEAALASSGDSADEQGVPMLLAHVHETGHFGDGHMNSSSDRAFELGFLHAALGLV